MSKATTKQADEKSDKQDPFGDASGGLTRYENFIRQYPLQAYLHDTENNKMTFDYPCLPMDLGRYGAHHLSDLLYPPFPCVMYHMTNKGAKSGKPWIFDVKQVKDKILTEVTLTCQLKIDQAVYAHGTNLSNLKADLRAYKGGAMNCHIMLDLFTTDRKQKLLSFYHNMVLFDLKAREPTKFPDSVATSMKSLDLKDYGVSRNLAEPYPVPQAFKFPVTVLWGHLDCNGHMVFSWYSRHAMDALVMAITSKATDAVKSLTVKHLEAGVSRLQVQYIKECRYGDKLELQVWQLPVTAATKEPEARVWMMRDGETVAKIGIRFYTPNK